jgi:hypothetical protein
MMKKSWPLVSALASILVHLSLAPVAGARVVRIAIQSREPAAAPTGRPTPAYEILRGVFYGELAPQDAHNSVITDIDKAPRGAKGLVEYSATFAIAKPVSAAAASGVLYYDVPNRGRGQVSADANGHIRVISGWQGDIAPTAQLQTANVPAAAGVQSAAFARFMDMPPGTTTLALIGGVPPPVLLPAAASTGDAHARLFRQAGDDQPVLEIARRDWAFADCTTTPFPGVADARKVCLRGSFDPAYAYGLSYQARNPKVLGIGFAATRDLIAFLRHAAADDAGTPNPVAGLVRFSVASGTSQSGNYLRSFVNLGFNADEAGHLVFDGVNPNIAARQVPLNVRFGLPGGAAALYELGSDGPVWWSRYDDQVRGRGTHSLLDRCNASSTCPKIVETFGSSEFWALRMSADLVGTDAKADLPLPANVRRYYFPGVTHNGSAFGGFSVSGETDLARCTLPGNPNPSNDTLHALQAALIEWVVAGREPPPSRYPTLAAGDLTAPTAKAMGWPAIPGAPGPEGRINPLFDYDLGAGFRYADESGVVSVEPPRIRNTLTQLVPRVNQDGNETAGVPSVQMLLPLGTYTGWNVLAEGYGKGGRCDFLGGFIPFARTRAQRQASGDPRASLEERYGTHQNYVDQVRTVSASQVAARLLSAADAEKLVAQAQKSAVLN